VSATTNPRARYIVVAIFENNLLKAYDVPEWAQDPFVNANVMMTLNLTKEGISSSPHDIVRLTTQKVPSSSYKRDNQDIKVDDQSFFTLTMKDGRFFNYYLTVIDRHTGMHAWLRKHRNDTRYLTPEDSHNIILNGTKH
jgi:hypothetical protein